MGKGKTISKQLYNMMLSGDYEEENPSKGMDRCNILSEEVVFEQPLE